MFDGTFLFFIICLFLITLLYTGGIMAPLNIFLLQIDLRDPRFWHNSYLILIFYALNLWSLKGVPQKQDKKKGWWQVLEGW